MKKSVVHSYVRSSDPDDPEATAAHSSARDDECLAMAMTADNVRGRSRKPAKRHVPVVSRATLSESNQRWDGEREGDSVLDAELRTEVVALRPRQVLAATLLVQGFQGRQVAAALKVAPETVSRWRQEPAFEALMHQMLQEAVDATKLGLVSLCAESVEHLRGLIRAFDDKTALKAISLILGKVGPVLGVIGTELSRPSVER